MSNIELVTVTRGGEWGAEAFRDAGEATFGCDEPVDYGSLLEASF
jgi:hypothetical protein